MDATSPSPGKTNHSPAQAWSYRVPSPPRLGVPPPALNDRGLPDLHLHLADHDSEPNGFANVEFLKTVTYDNLVTANVLLDWKYEHRRNAQQILPFLFLGPVTAARDAAFLQKEGITLVLAVRNTLSARAKLLLSKDAAALGIDTTTVDVAGNQELIAAFPSGIEIINQHLSYMYQLRQDQAQQIIKSSTGTSPPGRVLVFCESGNERSAALIIAYIMAMFSVDWVKATQFVQAQRFAVSIDDATKQLLQTYESMLKAKRDVLQFNRASPFTIGYPETGEKPRQNSKRTLNETYDEMEVDEGYKYDAARFEDRTAIAPFEE